MTILFFLAADPAKGANQVYDVCICSKSDGSTEASTCQQVVENQCLENSPRSRFMVSTSGVSNDCIQFLHWQEDSTDTSNTQWKSCEGSLTASPCFEPESCTCNIDAASSCAVGLKFTSTGSQLTTAEIIGIVCGAVAFVAIVGVAVWWFFFKKKAGMSPDERKKAKKAAKAAAAQGGAAPQQQDQFYRNTVTEHHVSQHQPQAGGASAAAARAPPPVPGGGGYAQQAGAAPPAPKRKRGAPPVPGQVPPV
uniref:Uncharacterized protein n=1 Tax=Chromera velia CCMP2878 TaxID=1169474 RepID=A0A0G4H7L5_9ALVE|eukprot:Cvel_25054.t1-p1 / transcript=Cvel_25054.t1 / gene=Cvel_25054 / organism=Chromera_velia_CCMP2878 / gene_product=hypothetical protein / transcript_product=hypothetical protein / location=Cvel_scaffold2786:6821-8681(+) / protein_length=250 / sequence_SO=supercontig / SO=protein_coding / is_pseudo=false